MGLSFRRALTSDAWALMALYQKVGSTFTDDPLFLQLDRLESAIDDGEWVWLLGEREGAITTMIACMIDSGQGLAKVSRIMIDPDRESAHEDLRASLRETLARLAEHTAGIDVVYCTTLTVPSQFQEVTLQEGFKILGIFPNAMTADTSRLNGLTAYYLRDTLATKRFSGFSVHETLKPFADIACRELGLESLTVAGGAGPVAEPSGASVSLEVVSAPNLVGRRFEKLSKRRKQMADFYPFQKPNLLLTDPNEELQIFARVMPANRFAALVAEDWLVPANPVEIYAKVIQLLRDQGMNYIEIINDAADTSGNHWILEAGFVPCCYIPAFKRQGDTRRDYVVFGRSFEHVCRPDPSTPKVFLDFFREHLKVEWRNYMG